MCFLCTMIHQRYQSTCFLSGFHCIDTVHNCKTSMHSLQHIILLRVSEIYGFPVGIKTIISMAYLALILILFLLPTIILCYLQMIQPFKKSQSPFVRFKLILPKFSTKLQGLLLNLVLQPPPCPQHVRLY